MISLNLRQGIGFDVEYNEDICHIVQTDDTEYGLYSFSGVIIMLPFIKIYVGDMEEVCDLSEVIE
jgi:hypothetical protein